MVCGGWNYCSETTTAEACLGYVTEQLGIHGADEVLPACNSCLPFAWFGLCTPFFMVC